jgi:hypothetical protein
MIVSRWLGVGWSTCPTGWDEALNERDADVLAAGA